VEFKLKFIIKIRNLTNLSKKRGAMALLLFLFSFFVVYALEASALNIKPSVTVVTLPVPANLIAVAVSPYQIDLSWDGVSGAASYNVYRDGAYIASTTVNFYSDSGLFPSTYYIYNVSAIDSGGIESSQSDSAQATTLSLPSAQEEIGGTIFIPPSPGKISITINNNAIYSNSIKVRLGLFAQNAFQMVISNNPDFIGSVWENYETDKEWFLTPREGEKKVYAKFKSFSGGVSDVISDSIILDLTPPANVINLESESGDKQVFLNWENSPEEDFREVWILRSENFYPYYPFDGVLVYRGGGTEFIDKGVVNNIRYYYTVFSFDKAGNFSSGAIISEVPISSLAPGLPPELPPEVPPTIPPEEVPPSVRELTLEDFDFIQEGKKLPIFNKETLRVEPDKPLTISIDYEKLPEVLKTIMVALQKNEKTFSFLLKIDGGKNRYSAVILPPEPQIYPFDIFIVNYKNQALKKVSGKMIIRKTGIFNPEISWEKIKESEIKFPIIWLIILLAFLTYIIRKRRKKKKEEELKKQEVEEIRKNGFDGLDNYFRKE